MRDTYYGNKVSQYGLEHGYVDYRCLAEAINMVLCNDITRADPDCLCNIESGDLFYYCDADGNTVDADYYNSLESEAQERYEEYEHEIYQYYITDYNGCQILKEAGEIVFYSELLDCYVWGVTHYGTSWDYVLTNIKLDSDTK